MSHYKACKEYQEWFFDEYGYIFCELCKKSNAFRFDTHHIVYASEKPKHKNLHDHKNLILLCRDCHIYLHSDKKRRENLYKRRGLNELFS